MRNITNPKFNWDEGLRQSDKMVKNIQRGKLSIREYFNVYKTGINDLVNHQARLDKAFSKKLNNGAQAVFVPGTKEMQQFTSAAELANRKLNIQREIISGLGTKVQDWGKNTQWAGRQLTVGLTVPLAMAAAGAAAYSLEIDKILNRIEKVYDGSDDIRKNAIVAAKEITNSMGTTVASSLDVMAELAAAGKTGQELIAITRIAQKTAVLGNLEQADSIKGVISIQNIFKMSTEQLADAMNYLNAVEAATPTNLKDLVDAIPIAGTMVAQLGGTLQDTAVLLTAFKERGIETVEGANAIKTAMNRVLSPTSTALKMFQQLTGEDLNKIVEETGGKPLETMQALSDAIMGGNIALEDQQRLVTKLVGIYQSSRITGLLTGLQQESGAVAKTKSLSRQSPSEWAQRADANLKAITESISGQFTRALENLKLQFQDVGNIALKVATFIMERFSGLLSLFNSMPDGLKQVTVFILGFLAVAGPITMLVGLFGNLAGTALKTLAVFKTIGTRTKSITLEQKAQQLATGQLNASMLSQADQTQILVYHLDKLRAAYMSTSQAAIAAHKAMSPIPLVPTTGMQGQLKAPTGLLGTNAWAAQTQQLVQQSTLTSAVAQNTEKATLAQRAFKTETLLSVGALAGVAAMTAESGGNMEKWLTYISLGAVALSALMPIVGKLGEKVKSVGSNLADGGKGLAGRAAGIASNLMSRLTAFLTNPLTLAAGGGLLAVWGIGKLITAQQEEQRRKLEAINNSTEKWAAVLGKARVTWGQIVDDKGNVQDTLESVAKGLKEQMPELVALVRSVRGGDLERVSREEVLKLQGQGLDKDEIENSMRALLLAAGKTREEIDDVMQDIKVTFDFSGGEKDLKAFLRDSKDALLRSLDPNASGMPNYEHPLVKMDIGTINWARLEGADKTKSLFMSRLASMSDAERVIFATQFADDIAKTYEESFKKMNESHGGKIASSWAEAREKLFNFKDGNWEEDREATLRSGLQSGLTSDDVENMKRMIESEKLLTQAIAQERGVSEDKIKNMSVISDILPHITQKQISSTEAQSAYNAILEKAAKSGKEMTAEEKQRLSALFASTFGLDAATLATNGYKEATKKTAQEIDDIKRSMLTFMQVVRSGRGDMSDFWSDIAIKDTGFQELGGDMAKQAGDLTNMVKEAYSGTMSTVYDALAAQAEEQWQSKLDGISKSFENRRKALDLEGKRADKTYELQREAFEDRWDATMEASRKSFEDRQKAIEDGIEAEIDAIDDQIEAEQDREDARQKHFDAEKRRIERLTELSNRMIDYNRAIASGNLDEAARVMNNSEAVTVGWGFDDAQDASNEASSARRKQLENTKQTLQDKKQALLESLREEERATEASLDKQREMQQRAMENARDLERERLQNRIDSLQTEQAATEAAERRKQEMNRRTLEIELQTLRAFVPQNEAELSAHIGKVSAAYGHYGLNLQTTGGYWGQIIGNALANNVDRARAEMSNTAAWSAFGASVAGAVAQGAFGLSLGDFFNLITTGTPPSNWQPPGTTHTPSIGRQIGAFHVGGEVGSSLGSRKGRAGPIAGDEQLAILQKGEFVFPKHAVQTYGSENLARMAQGIPTAPTPVVGIGGLFGGAIAGMMTGMMSMAMSRMMSSAMGSYGGGTGSAVDFARAQDGKPYVWGAAGPNGYDCSGFMSAIANVLTGKDPYRRIFSTGMMRPGVPLGPFEPGLGGPFQIGVKHGNPGHTAGTLLGTNVESTGDHVRYGKDAHGALDKQFTMHFHVPDKNVVAGAAIPGLNGVLPEGGAGVERWRGHVVRALAMLGLSPSWTQSTLRRMNQESGGDPRAINNWDSNARRGTPSKGLMQVIDPTFAAHYDPRTKFDIWDPMANIVASMKYAMKRYGSLPAGYDRKGGYDQGGDILPGDTLVHNGLRTVETLVNTKTRDELIGALKAANVSYAGFSGILKGATQAVNANANNGTKESSVVNHYTINVNGSELSKKELKEVMVNVIEETDIKRKRKNGGMN